MSVHRQAAIKRQMDAASACRSALHNGRRNLFVGGSAAPEPLVNTPTGHNTGHLSLGQCHLPPHDGTIGVILS